MADRLDSCAVLRPSLLSRVERLHSQAACFSDPIGGPEQGRNATRERILGHQSLFAWLSGNCRVPQASFDPLVHLLSPPRSKLTF